MKKITAFFIALAVLAVFASDLFAINWHNDMAKAQVEARQSGKPVMADFYTDWCGWCKKLDRDTYSDKDVSALADQFISVKIDGDRNRPLASKFGVRGYPTIIFLNFEGSIDDVVSGYLPPREFLKVMTAVLKKTKKAVAAKGSGAAVPVGPALKLSGIILDPSLPKAIINDAIVRVGDVVEGAKVVKITATNVVLTAGGREISLKMEE
jgi:thioredoxin-related protein